MNHLVFLKGVLRSTVSPNLKTTKNQAAQRSGESSSPLGRQNTARASETGGGGRGIVAKFRDTVIQARKSILRGRQGTDLRRSGQKTPSDYWKGDHSLGLREESPEFCPAGVVPAAVRNESTRSPARCTSRSRPGNTRAQARPSRRW